MRYLFLLFVLTGVNAKADDYGMGRGQVHVQGHYRDNGAYVQPYIREAPSNYGNSGYDRGDTKSNYPSYDYSHPVRPFGQ